RQVRDARLVGLYAALDIGTWQLAKRPVRKVLSMGETCGKGRELFARSKYTRIDEVEYRPEIAEPVLDWSTGKRDASVRVELLDQACLFGAGILDGLCFVDNSKPPGDFQELRNPQE